MLTYLFIALFFGVIAAIYWGFWHGTRTKLDNEDIKSEFLESKFNYLKDLKFDKETITQDPDFQRILEIFRKAGYKKGTVTEINSSLPYSEKKPWKVYATVKAGTWPFTDKEDSIEIYSIFDKELSVLIEK